MPYVPLFPSHLPAATRRVPHTHTTVRHSVTSALFSNSAYLAENTKQMPVPYPLPFQEHAHSLHTHRPQLLIYLSPIKINGGGSTLIRFPRESCQHNNLSAGFVFLHAPVSFDNFVQMEDFADLNLQFARHDLRYEVLQRHSHEIFNVSSVNREANG